MARGIGDGHAFADAEIALGDFAVMQQLLARAGGRDAAAMSANGRRPAITRRVG
jgi:hypothetical protein